MNISQIGSNLAGAVSTEAAAVTPTTESSTKEPVVSSADKVTLSEEALALLKKDEESGSETMGSGSGGVPDLPVKEPKAQTLGSGSGGVPDLPK
jgi:hypothetical protein